MSFESFTLNVQGLRKPRAASLVGIETKAYRGDLLVEGILEGRDKYYAKGHYKGYYHRGPEKTIVQPLGKATRAWLSGVRLQHR